jgi:hypothetical protein
MALGRPKSLRVAIWLNDFELCGKIIAQSADYEREGPETDDDWGQEAEQEFHLDPASMSYQETLAFPPEIIWTSTRAFRETRKLGDASTPNGLVMAVHALG